MRPECEACSTWLEDHLSTEDRIILPEIFDYEIRRELILGSKTAGLRRLDRITETIEYLPLDTAMLHEAASLWASARRAGHLTAPKEALDIDVILAAQSMSLARTAKNVVIATLNVGHLSHFVDARHWQDI